MSGDLMAPGQPVTMSSREIAELCEKRHDNVRRTIDALAERGVISLPQIEEVKVQRERRDETVKVYRLEKRDTFVVVAQLSPEFTARVVDRWQELESRPAFDPSAFFEDPAAMRGLLLTYADKVLALQSQVQEMQPAVVAYERIAVSDGSLCITDAAKTLQMRPKDLFARLRATGWIYSRGGGAEVAYQDKIAAGLLEHKTTTVTRSDGTEKTVSQVRVAPKGLARLAKLVTPQPGLLE